MCDANIPNSQGNVNIFLRVYRVFCSVITVCGANIPDLQGDVNIFLIFFERFL
jgi:hypothetical protein